METPVLRFNKELVFRNHMCILTNDIMKNSARSGCAVNIHQAFFQFRTQFDIQFRAYAFPPVPAILTAVNQRKLFYEIEANTGRIYGPLLHNDHVTSAVYHGYDVVALYFTQSGFRESRLTLRNLPLPRHLFRDVVRPVGFLIESPSGEPIGKNTLVHFSTASTSGNAK